MPSVVATLASSFGLWVVFTYLKNEWSWRRIRKNGEKYGAAKPKELTSKLPWGLDRYVDMLKGGREGLDVLEDILRPRHESLHYTYRCPDLFYHSFVSTSEPENIQTILATKFHDYELGPTRRENFFQLLGNGIFTADGEPWVHFRSQLRPQFTREQVGDLETAEHHLDILYRTLPQADSDGWIPESDIMPSIYRFVMDVVTEFLLGQSVNSQSTEIHAAETGYSKEHQEEMAFEDAIAYTQIVIVKRMFLSSYYWLMSPAKFVEACMVVKDFAGQAVEKALDPSFKRERPDKFVILDSMVSETRDPVELRDQALHLLLAGRDTTSALISWTLILIALHPDEYTRLRADILAHFGTRTEPIQAMTFTSLKACKSINQLLHEVLRLYPLVPQNMRLALRDTMLPRGGGPDGSKPVMIRKGESINFNSYVMHRRQDLWGENAGAFRPARWEGRKLGWDFLGFSGGPRICLGQQYALNEASFVIAKLIQRFDKFELVGGAHDPLEKQLSLTLKPANGVRVRMHCADE